MADERIMRAIVDKCDFYYGDSLLSKETIIEKYFWFMLKFVILFREYFNQSRKHLIKNGENTKIDFGSKTSNDNKLKSKYKKFKIIIFKS